MSDVATLLDAAAVEAIQPEWQDLWQRAVRAMPFQSPAWLAPWWRQFGTARPVVGVLREAGRLVGLLPTYVLEEDGGRKLLPWGVGLSDYYDVLLAPDAPTDAAARLLEAVLAAAPDVPVFDCPDLPPDAALLRLAAPSGWSGDTQPGPTCPVLDLTSAGPDLAGAVPSATRRKLRMNGHRAERLGGSSVEFATADTLEAHLATLSRFHQARWVARGQPGVFADPRVAAFHADAAPGLLDEGLLRLATLRIGGRVAATVLALAWPPDRLAFYLSGFEADLAAASPGSLLCAHLIEHARQADATEIHFLRGDEGYKHAWGASDRFNTLRRFRRTP